MSQPQQCITSSNEARLTLAIHATKRDAKITYRTAAKVYDASRSTLGHRLNGRPSRRDCEPNSKKLTKQEEEVLLEYILELDLRGFPPSKVSVQAMADSLLQEKGSKPAGKCWTDRFIQRHPELKVRMTRGYDRQRALNEDPEVINQWFLLVRNMKEKYGILDQDTYNFDETGFMMGIITSQSVVTGSERRGGKRKVVQQGNREWATVIETICADGTALPPYVILAGKQHISTWYQDGNLGPDWTVGLTENGWTNNEFGVRWLEHFQKHTVARTTGAWRLLIIDGHESHNSKAFQNLCKEYKILALCMPSHASHLLQPLDVGCYSPLKKAYGAELSGLARQRITHIDKVEFLRAFRAAHDAVFRQENILSSFRGAGLVPFNPQAVIDKLDVKLRTPTPPAPDYTPWESKTPRTAKEFDSQSILVTNKMRARAGSSPNSLQEGVLQLVKGSREIAHQIALMRSEISELRKSNEALTQRKARKRKYIQSGGSLTFDEALQLIPPEVTRRQEVSRESLDGVRPAPRQRRCKRCGESGHNVRTCQVDLSDSSSSEEELSS